MSAKNLLITASIPFVNNHWMTDIFVVKGHKKVCFSDEVTRMITPLSLPNDSQKFLLHLAKHVNEIQLKISEVPELAEQLGLADTPPQTGNGYISLRQHIQPFFYPFMCAIVLDQCLWSLSFEKESINVQWVHPLSGHLTTARQTLEKHLDKLLQGFWVSYGAHGLVNLGQRGSPDVALNAEVVVHSANHKSTAELHAALGNLYGMVGILLSLLVLNKQDHLEKVMEAVLLLSCFNRSDSHHPPTLQAKLVDIYRHLQYQDLQSYYYAIIVSILEIFANKFSRKKVVMYNYNMHDMMKAQLSASSRGCMHALTLHAERGIWEHILTIIGGKDSQPLQLPATFSNIGGKSLQITQGTNGSHAKRSSVPVSNAELQTKKVDLQLMYQHETSENQLDQLATDLGPVDDGICFIKRQVWQHGSLLSYEVPENVCLIYTSMMAILV
ncbi:hypothetical protein K439DRAFT_1625122 [Ramaria rubella]|nr:hypothetical protein K439DRAFT_1625122 [Ramaria rubella]